MTLLKLNISFFFLLFCLCVSGQEWKELGADELFEKARAEAFDGNREKAREMLQYILEGSPDYADVRILLGRTYAWDGKRSQAIKEFERVLDKDPEYKDAINALTDVLMWDDNYEKGLKTVNSGLKHYPNFEDFLYKKASILNNLNREEEALTVINQLIRLAPGNDQAISLRESIQTGQQRYTVNVTGTFENYSREGADPAYYSAISLGRSNDWGSSIVRLNYSNRFGLNGTQGEIDLYPRIVSGVYAYLNYGYSTGRLYPNHRLGAEVFTSLPKSTEGSIGLRHLIFSPTSQITIYTGSFGLYYKSLWLSLRPFITPDKNTGTSVSFSLTLRRYFSNPETFLSFSGGLGYSPENILQSSSGFASDAIYTLKSQRASIGFQKLLKYNLVASIDLNTSRQELSFDVGNFMWVTNIQCGVTYRF
ncbi:MAG: YaiO family outer membrane beta-barrel protein [Cyclobacteriaceae bacterium]